MLDIPELIKRTILAVSDPEFGDVQRVAARLGFDLDHARVAVMPKGAFAIDGATAADGITRVSVAGAVTPSPRVDVLVVDGAIQSCDQKLLQECLPEARRIASKVPDGVSYEKSADGLTFGVSADRDGGPIRSVFCRANATSARS